jgi:hypothetical protein
MAEVNQLSVVNKMARIGLEVLQKCENERKGTVKAGESPLDTLFRDMAFTYSLGPSLEVMEPKLTPGDIYRNN